MVYILGMIMAGVGAGVLIFALTFVTLLLTAIILSMLSFTAAPILDRVFKD
ncbi:MAG: hypothetical protein ACREL5_02335 [Gemmatimonadales bacterium]